MPLVLLIVVLFVLAVLAIWITFGLVRLLLTLFIAGLVGWVADAIVPGRLPYGWLGAIVAGLIGSLIGQLLIGHVGPEIFGIRPIPALVGAVILAVIASLIGKSAAGRGRF